MVAKRHSLRSRVRTRAAFVASKTPAGRIPHGGPSRQVACLGAAQLRPSARHGEAGAECREQMANGKWQMAKGGGLSGTHKS